MFVFSPSNMSTYRTCPRKFQAQTLTKELPWQATAQKSRGTLVHNVVEMALRSGLDAVTSWPEGIDLDYTRNSVAAVRESAANGGQVLIEEELTLNKTFSPTPEGWWDKTAFIRARADAVIIPAGGVPPLVVDIKTGKKWDDDDFQLRVNTLLLHFVKKFPVIRYEYWYVDSGETFGSTIDFARGLSPVQDVIELMKEMNISIRDGYFPSQKNKFCKWCGLHGTPSCGL